MTITLKELQSILPIEDVLMGGVQYAMPKGFSENVTFPVGFPGSQAGGITGTSSGTNTQSGTYIPGITQPNQGGNGFNNTGINSIGSTSGLFGLQTNDFVNAKNLGLMALGFNPVSLAFGTIASAGIGQLIDNYQNPYTNIFGNLNQQTRDAIGRQGRDSAPGRGDAGNPGGSSGSMDDSNAGSFCFDPSTLIQMADGSTKQIKNIQLGDQTKGGEVTGVFQFKATDEIHDYKGVTVAGSHFVKEDGKFIMVKDSPLSVKIDKIPVVYSLDTTGRRIFIKDIEFADYNGDGVAKNFLNNAGINVPEFNKEVLRQVEQRLI